MALITCPECGGKISDKTVVCIHCGYPLREHNKTTHVDVKYYSATLENYSTKKPYYDRAANLLHLFPEAEHNFYSFTNTSPYRLCTGLTDENAKWLKEEFGKAKATVSVGIDEDCTSPNEFVNQYIDEERRGLIHCPACHSTVITTGARGVNGLFGFIGASKTVNRCSKCGFAWVPGR